MQKINIKGKYQELIPLYDNTISREKRNSINWRDWEVCDVKEFPTKDKPNVKCDCGCENFRVCWIHYPDTGGFCKVVCSECGESFVFINDFA